MPAISRQRLGSSSCSWRQDRKNFCPFLTFRDVPRNGRHSSLLPALYFEENVSFFPLVTGWRDNPFHTPEETFLDLIYGVPTSYNLHLQLAYTYSSKKSTPEYKTSFRSAASFFGKSYRYSGSCSSMQRTSSAHSGLISFSCVLTMDLAGSKNFLG